MSIGNMHTILFLVLGILGSSLADVPVHCLYEDARGTWIFSEGERNGNHTINCDHFEEPEFVHETEITLEYPDVAVDHLGNTGTWTIVVDQGFEVNINGRSYFAYFYYEGSPPETISQCGLTFSGWSRDDTIRNWSCFMGAKTVVVPPKATPEISTKVPKGMFKNDHQLIEKINQSQKSWWAKPYPEYEKFTVEQMFYRAGGKRSMKSLLHLPKSSAPITEEQRIMMQSLPESFDWRDVQGVNYVSPVRDQGACGSCYSFASMGLIEARLRIATDNQRQDIFSPQDAMTCTVLGQGCGGGFNFLTAGRHAMEQGVVAEECNPYSEQDEPCDTDMSCPRTYVSDYDFVGGFFGASNEANMMKELVENGPLGVALDMPMDLLYYAGGIYHNTGLSNKFDPFEFANHAVLAVGYGVDPDTSEKYWILKNSWGPTYGEEGYFRIKKGVDENAIESCATRVTVIP